MESRLPRLVLLVLLVAGCANTGFQRPNSIAAPPIPTPSPIGPGQAPSSGPVVTPPPGSTIPLPPGTPPNTAPPLPSVGQGPGMSGAMVNPNSPEQARVNYTAQRLYQANPWLTVKPRWSVIPGDTPGVTTQGDQQALISESLVRSASDGQLAAVMSLQLGDLVAAKQRTMQTSPVREVSPPPDYYQQRDGMSSTQATLELAEIAKYRKDPRDLRRQSMQPPPIEPPNCARQVLVQAGYSEQELDQAAPLLQRYPLVRPAK